MYYTAEKAMRPNIIIIALIAAFIAGCASFPISDRSGKYGRGIFVTPGSKHALLFNSPDMSRLSGDHKEYLDTVVAWLARNPRHGVRITGYSKRLATPEETKENALSAAKNVMEYMMNRGIPGGRLFFRAAAPQPADRPEDKKSDPPNPNRVVLLILRN
jgi:outer membrane protein OmpA-like peptidoglycan-associated protein